MDTSRQQRTAAKRLAADLRAYRMGQHVSLSTVREQTKISRGILEEFESSGLADNPLFNRVYLRSLVTSYARCVGLEEARALDALEAALDGVYEGGLCGASKGEADQGAQSSDEIEHADTAREESPGDTAATDSSQDRRHSVGTASLQHSGDRSAHIIEKRQHTEISTAVTGFKEPEEQRGLIVQPGRVRALALGVLVLVITVSAVLIAMRLSSSNAQTGESPTSIVSEAARSSVTIETSNQVPTLQPLEPDPVESIATATPTISIGDTIAVTLIAAGGPLDPIRIRLDRDLRRPYWIEEGDSLTFRMARRIVVQDLLDRLKIKVEGVPYPFEAGGDSAEVVVTRDSVTSFVETLGSR